jgi:hypothetical protein
VCRHLRAQDGSSVRPTMIALAGWGQESDRQPSSEAGFGHDLAKPVQVDAVNEPLR